LFKIQNQQILCTLKLTLDVDEFMFQIQHIKQQEGTSSDAVQQGEVSSSKPTILASEVFGPLLLEV
jgi:nuclear receptor coactivator 2